MEQVSKFVGKGPEKLFSRIFLPQPSSNPSAVARRATLAGSRRGCDSDPQAATCAHRLNEALYIFVLSHAFLQKHVTGSKSNMYS